MSFFPKISFHREVEEYLTKVFRNNEVCETDAATIHQQIYTLNTVNIPSI